MDPLFNAHPSLKEAWEYVVTDDCIVKKTIFICKGNIKELFFGKTFAAAATLHLSLLLRKEKITPSNLSSHCERSIPDGGDNESGRRGR